MSRQYPALVPDDAPKYKGAQSIDDLVANDFKHYPGQNQAQFCW